MKFARISAKLNSLTAAAIMVAACGLLADSTASAGEHPNPPLGVSQGRFVMADGSIMVPRGFNISGYRFVDDAQQFAQNWEQSPEQWLDRLQEHGVNFLFISNALRLSEDNAGELRRNLAWLLEQCQQRDIFVSLSIDTRSLEEAKATIDFCIEEYGRFESFALWQLGSNTEALEELTVHISEADPLQRPVGADLTRVPPETRRAILSSNQPPEWFRLHSGGNWARTDFDGYENRPAIVAMGYGAGLPVPPGPTGLRRYPAAGNFHPATLTWGIWRGVAGFSSELVSLRPFGDEGHDQVARENFQKILDSLAIFAEAVSKTIEQDNWGRHITAPPPQGNHQFTMTSDGSHLIFNCIGALDAASFGQNTRINLSGIRPGEYEVSWYFAMSEEPVTERVRLGTKPSVVSPQRPWMMYIRPADD